MKKACLTLIAALAATTAFTAPVLAQPYGPPPAPGAYDRDHDHRGPDQPGGWAIDRRIDWLQDRINHGRADGSLDRREFHRVQFQLNDIKHDFRRAMHRGEGRLDDRARDMLGDRLNHLNDEIHWLRDNGEHRPW